MYFCPKCHLVLIPTQKDKKSVVLRCQKCGLETSKSSPTTTWFGERKESIVVIGEKEAGVQTLPKTKADCPKCGNDEAFYWQVQTRGGDESMTVFFRCTKCSSTWRESN
jgi:DNA-directed RNA polymerase subunit M